MGEQPNFVPRDENCRARQRVQSPRYLLLKIFCADHTLYLADRSVLWPGLLELAQFHQEAITALQVVLRFSIIGRFE